MTYKALCSSCLRVVPFKTQLGFAGAQANEVLCLCGGDLCGCAGCLSVLAELERDNLACAKLLGVRMESWGADGGAVGITKTPEVYGILSDPAVGGGKTVTIEDIARSLGIKNVYVTKRAEPLNPELGHLSLTRRQYESVQIGSDIVLTVLKVRADSIAIAFSQGDKRFGSQNLPIDGTAYTMGGAVSVRVADIKGSQVRLHFEAPRSIPIVRTELL